MAAIRTEFAPTPGEPGAKSTECAGCGAEFWQWERKYGKYCATCSADRSTRVIRANRTKSGPVYEKVVRGQLRYWLGEAARLGLAPDVD